MIPGLTRSKHAEKIWAAMKLAGVESFSIRIRGVGEVALTRALLFEFLCLLRGNKVDQLVGPWVNGLRDLFQMRGAMVRAEAVGQEIAGAWTTDISAADAVAEQRR